MLDSILETLNTNFILTKLNTIRFILTIPLLLIAIRRFFKQIPLEEHYNKGKQLPSFFFDFFSKFIFVLFFIIEGILLFSQNKTGIYSFSFLLNYTNYIFLGLLVLILLLIDYHPWFITVRMIMFIFLHIAPRNSNVLFFNVIFILLSEIGLRQKPWNQKSLYTLYRYLALLTVALCFLKSRKFLFV